MAAGAVADQTPDTGHCGLFLSSGDPGGGDTQGAGVLGAAPPLEGKRTMETFSGVPPGQEKREERSPSPESSSP